MTIQEAVNLALQHHNSGRLADAESIYRQILAVEPNNAEVLHLLGVARHQAGDSRGGIDLIDRAISVRRDPMFLANLGELCREAGLVQKGIAACQEAIQLDARRVPAYHNLAVLLQRDRRLEEALQVARAAANINPNDASTHRIIGRILIEMGREHEGIAEFDLALKIRPTDGMSWMQLGAAYNAVVRVEHAIYCCEQAVKLMPHSVPALFDLGKLLLSRGRCAEALANFERLRQLIPPTVELELCIAGSLEGMNRFDEAIAICRSVLDREPRNLRATLIIADALVQAARCKEAEAFLLKAMETTTSPMLHRGMCITLARDGRFPEALAQAEKSLELEPGNAFSEFGKGVCMLFMGQYDPGWKFFESRWKSPRAEAWRHTTDKPTWDGKPLDGKWILLHAEQGVGDTIQFARYATLVAERGGRVILEVQAGLESLVKTIAGVERVIVRGQSAGHYDTLAALLSLPAIMGTTVATIPGKVPYVRTDPAKVEKWRTIIGPKTGKFRVGIAWLGSDLLRENHLRSMPLSGFAPLVKIPSVQFFSFQKGSSALVPKTDPPAGMEMIDLDPHIKDFSDTAAALTYMDLVISVDTALIHLAGALAMPVWNLLACNIDHRWLTERLDTPWYPTMRLFRQKTLGVWPETMERVADELAKTVAAKGA